MKYTALMLALSFTFSPVAKADFIIGNLQLVDAMYLYDQELTANDKKRLVGANCDVFQLVLDVTSGFSDIAYSESDTLSNAISSKTAYPDRILDSDAMFAYALYQNKATKVFTFRDKNNLSSSGATGGGTVFGYCYSTDPTAYIYFQEYDKCKNTLSNGTSLSILSCLITIPPIIPPITIPPIIPPITIPPIINPIQI